MVRTMIDLDGLEWEFMYYNSNPNDEPNDPKPYMSVRRFKNHIIQILLIQKIGTSNSVGQTILDALDNNDIEMFDILCKINNIKLFNKEYIIKDDSRCDK